MNTPNKFNHYLASDKCIRLNRNKRKSCKFVGNNVLFSCGQAQEIPLHAKNRTPGGPELREFGPGHVLQHLPGQKKGRYFALARAGSLTKAEKVVNSRLI